MNVFYLTTEITEEYGEYRGLITSRLNSVISVYSVVKLYFDILSRD